MARIDLNCDMGESFGAWKMGNDAEIMPFVTSVNIACGFHAGDPTVMRKTVQLALEHDVAVGAHPSYPDLQGFGRRNMKLSAEEIYDLLIYQIGALNAVCSAVGAKLNHVKPHGALYNRSVIDPKVAKAIAKAVSSFDSSLILFGLSGSESIKQAREVGLKTANEVFSDRTYTEEGTLTPRSEDGALITDSDISVKQITTMIEEGHVVSTGGQKVEIEADTVCIHGDGENALNIAQQIKTSLKERGIEVSAP